MPALLDLKPADTPDYMIPMWIACVHWAAGEPGILERFRAETGSAWQPARNGLEQMIDQATGSEWGFVEAFTKWVNVNIWGPIDGPPKDGI